MAKKKSKRRNLKIMKQIFTIILILIIGMLYPDFQENSNNINNQQIESTISYNLNDIPEYEGQPYVVINNNIPYFDEEDYTTESFEKYSELDDLYGRCGVAYANICEEIRPEDKEERDELTYNPTGWKQKEYKELVDGGYLYNRCHLIGWQLAGENNNKLNLITGTRYMNIEGMLKFENQIDDYLDKEENEENHVLYRVTPIFEGDNLVASGVQMEAYSVEDNGEGVCFNVYIYNVQPGIVIDYKTGDSWLEE